MSTLQRTQDWLSKLDEYLAAHMNSAFVWGENDCCLFAANAVQAMTSVDIADDFRGKYSDQISAFKLVKSVTGGTAVTDALVYCATKHGLVEWTRPDGTALPLMAKRGDLVAVTNLDGEIIAGVVDLSGRFVAAMGESGVVRLPFQSITRAWHLPAH